MGKCYNEINFYFDISWFVTIALLKNLKVSLGGEISVITKSM